MLRTLAEIVSIGSQRSGNTRHSTKERESAESHSGDGVDHHHHHNNYNTPTSTGTNNSGYEAVKMSSLLKLPALLLDPEYGPQNCYALNERTVAVESCWFLATVISFHAVSS